MTGGATHEWEFADMWLLAAIGTYRRPCSLAELLAAADRLNDTLPLEDEVESALGRLTGAGLVRVFEDWTVELTDDATSLELGAGLDLDVQVKLLRIQLADLEPGTTRVKLSRGIMSEAVEEYRSW
ncbi:MAG: hypothetical protein JWP74_1435 [Marmoricola sp.]|nr:hypothetical protein [Marmoricola sp.]